MLASLLYKPTLYLLYFSVNFACTVSSTLNTGRPEPIHSQIFEDLSPVGGLTRFGYNFITWQRAEKFLRGQEVEEFLSESSSSTGKRVLIKATSELSYACQLPSYSESGYSLGDDRVIPPDNFTETALSAIESLRGTCAERIISGWNYKICFGVNVVQTKLLDSKKVTISYILGDAMYPTPPLPNTSNLLETYYDGLYSQYPHFYIAQRWTEGTFCEKTKRPRESEIRYECLVAHNEGLIHIRERSTCNYILIVNIKSLCSKQFINNKSPQDHTKCIPIINEGIIDPPPSDNSSTNNVNKLLFGPGKWFYRWSFENQATCKPEHIYLLKLSTLVQHLTFSMGADTRAFISPRSDDEAWFRPGKLYAVYEDSPKIIIGVLNLQDMLDDIVSSKSDLSLSKWLVSPKSLEAELLDELKNASHMVYDVYSFTTPFRSSLI